MKIFIDGDGCPVIDLTISMAKNYGLECIIICDTAHSIERDDAKTITVSKGRDSADFYLVNMLSKEDICVTQDYGLAAMCLSKKAFALNQNGLIYDETNIDSLLQSRYQAQKIRRAGGRLKGPTKRTAEQNEKIQNITRKFDYEDKERRIVVSVIEAWCYLSKKMFSLSR